MSRQSENVKRWRVNCKSRIITAMGGVCCICGYNKCHRALVLHHLNPKEKDISFGTIRANPKSWQLIVKELRKCILVCSNCHAEIHEEVIVIPEDAPRFNETFTDYLLLEEKFVDLTACPICGKLKPVHLINCSRECAGKSRGKIDWERINLQEELKGKSILALSEEIGCSDGAIHRRLRKLGLK